MVLCIIAFFVFAFLSIFSAKYRPLAREGFECVFKTITLRPCDTGMDDRIKAHFVSETLKYSPMAARLLNNHFTLVSWIFVILTIGSFAYSAYGVYNFYYYGNCDGPTSITGVCVLNDITGDYGRFSEPKDLIAPTTLDGITAGKPDADVVIVEFGCFTCPYTKQAESAVTQIVEDYSDSVYYVFKPFPLPQHGGSYETAKAVLCAEKQGKHWELKDEIFAQQMVCAEQGNIAIRDIAEAVGLDMEEFDACYDSSETVAELEKYISQGEESNIYATPTFFINGQPAIGPQTYEDLESIILEVSSFESQ